MKHKTLIIDRTDADIWGTKRRHTPGPWKADGQLIVGYPDSSIAVAKTFGNVGQPTEANARLIAAGPELLAVCKSVLAFTVSDNYDWKGAINEIRVEARAAILKARAGQ